MVIDEPSETSGRTNRIPLVSYTPRAFPLSTATLDIYCRSRVAIFRIADRPASTITVVIALLVYEVRRFQTGNKSHLITPREKNNHNRRCATQLE